jgi:hypothetical protein
MKKTTLALFHTPSGVAFKLDGTSKSSTTARGIVSANISNFFNANKKTILNKFDTQSGLIIERMKQNLLSATSYDDAREATIDEFMVIKVY